MTDNHVVLFNPPYTSGNSIDDFRSIHAGRIFDDLYYCSYSHQVVQVPQTVHHDQVQRIIGTDTPVFCGNERLTCRIGGI